MSSLGDEISPNMYSDIDRETPVTEIPTGKVTGIMCRWCKSSVFYMMKRVV